MDIAEIRKHLPITEQLAYLNNAASGPLTRETVEAIHRALEEREMLGSNWPVWIGHTVEAAARFAQLVGSEKNEIATVPNLTTGLWAIALCLKTQRDQNIVLNDLEFPANVYPWIALKNAGRIGEIRMVRNTGGNIEAEKFAEAIDRKTAVVPLHYASSFNGHRPETKEICKIAHENGAIVVSDAFQAVGLVPIDVKREGIDVLLSGVYKFLLGPSGIGFMYVDKNILPRFEIGIVGWGGIHSEIQEKLSRPYDYSTLRVAEDASRFNTGHFSVSASFGAEAALDFSLRHKVPEQFEQTQKRLVKRLIEGIGEIGLKLQSPNRLEKLGATVSVAAKDPEGTVSHLQKKRIIVSWRYVPGVGPGIRISPHFYNTEEEVDRLITALKQLSLQVKA